MDKRVVKSINKYLADIAVSYIKIHNLHWNVVGPQFKAVHEYLESIYDSYAEVLDDVAELLKINGEIPAASLKEYLALSDIEELESVSVDVEKAIKITLADTRKLRDEALDIRKAADESDDFGTVNLLEDHIANYNKNIWFLDSMLK
ncbi:MAG: DNA starvation/stationary phase protection protein [Pseudobutyrivibrio sp.]|nr:DNA starvation/stationary phase protection protein [Pseudobutyrivibrio sp.]